jgi:hypothetical protein
VLFLDLLRLEYLVKYLRASSKDWASSLGSLVVRSGTRSSCESLPLLRLISLGVSSTCSAGGSSISFAVSNSICSTAACSVGSAEVSSAEVSSAGVSSAQVGSAQVSSVQVSSAAEVSSAQVGSAQVGSVQVSSAGVS